MPITKGCGQLVEEASRKIRTLSLEQAMKKHGDPFPAGMAWPSTKNGSN